MAPTAFGGGANPFQFRAKWMLVADVAEQPGKLALMRGQHDLRIMRGLDGLEQPIRRLGKARQRVGIQHQRRWADNAVSTKSRVRSPTPAPGPITQALKRLSVSHSANSTAVSIGANHHGRQRRGIDGERIARRGQVTRPAPARSAPRADIRAAPVAAISPETTMAWPRAYLWPSTCGTGNASCQDCGSVLERLRPDFVKHVRIDADVGNAHATAVDPARQQQMRGLAAEERDGFGRRDRNPHHRARRAVDAARQVDGENRQRHWH